VNYTDSQGNKVTAHRAKVPVFSIGGTSYDGLTAMQIDIANIPGFSCYNIAGVIGPEVIGRKVWTLDFDAQTVTITDTLTEITPGSISIPLVRRFNDQPWFHLSMANGDSILCCFDTGSNGSLSLNRHDAALLSDEPLSFVECGYTGTGGGGYGQPDTTLNVTTTRTVSIGSQNLAGVPIRLHSKPANIMGTQVMRRYRIALDYHNDCIVFMPKAIDEKRQSAYVRGVTFGYNDGHIIVASTRGATAADMPDVHIGTVVTAINGQRLPQPATPADLCEILASDYQHIKKLRLTILDGKGKERKVCIKQKQRLLK